MDESAAPKLLILQRFVADYRVGFYRALAAELGHGFKVTTGEDRFTQALTRVSPDHDWLLHIKNRFFARDSLLWQSGHWAAACKAHLVVAELNPRIVSTWALLIVRRLLRRPTVVWGHSTSLGPRSALISCLRFWQCRLADAVLAYTDTQASEFQTRLPDKKIHVAPNACLGRDECIPVPFHTAHDVVYVGRLIEEKKVDLLIAGFARAAPNLPANASLVLVGSGPAREFLEAQAEALGVSSRVQFAGHISDPQRLKLIYERAACAVSPGYIGLSAMQALGFGIPLLVADKEFHSPEIEACREGETCLFFSSGNAESLGAGLVTFYSEAEQWAVRRERIAKLIAERYSFERMAEEFSAIVRQFLAAGSQETARLQTR
jgi:glycosyltransferase involved in cell wall biosynthesis